MAGLDTRGVMDGFVQGFSMMDQYKNRQFQQQRMKEQDELQKQRYAEQDRRYQESIDYRNERAGIQDERYTENLNYNRERLGIQDERYADEQSYNRGRLNKQDQRQQKQDNRNEDVEFAKGYYANLGTTGEPGLTTEEDWQRLEQVANRNGDLIGGLTKKQLQQRREDAKNNEFITGVQTAFTNLVTPGAAFTEQDEAALANANNDVTRAAVPEAMEAAQTLDDLFSPDSDIDMNSPKTIEAANLIFGDMVGEGKRIEAIMPGKQPGTVVFSLSIDGKESEPMTDNRGTEAEGDNMVMQVPVEELIDAANGFKATAYHFSMDEEARQKAINFAIKRGLYAAPKAGEAGGMAGSDKGNGKFRREQITQFSKDYTKIITDPEMINFPEQQKQAIDALETHYAKTLGVPKKEFTRLITYNAQGLVDDQTHRSIMNMHGTPEVGLEEPEAVTQEDQPPVGLAQQPSKTTKLGQQQIQDDLKNIEGLDGASLYGVRQTAKILQDDSEGITGQSIRWMLDQGREQQERQSQQRSETTNSPAQARIEQATKGEQVQVIQQQLQRLKARVNAGDPKAIELAQQLTARLAEITSQ